MAEKNKGMERRGGNRNNRKQQEREQEVKRRKNVDVGYVMSNPNVKKKKNTT